MDNDEEVISDGDEHEVSSGPPENLEETSASVESGGDIMARSIMDSTSVILDEPSKEVRDADSPPISAEPSTKKRKITWNDSETRCLFEACHEFRIGRATSSGGRPGGKWEAVAKRIAAATGTQFNPSSCKSRWAYLRKEYKNWIDALEETESRKQQSPKSSTELQRVHGGVDCLNFAPEISAAADEDESEEQDSAKENDIPCTSKESSRDGKPTRTQHKPVKRFRRRRLVTGNFKFLKLRSFMLEMESSRIDREERRHRASIEKIRAILEVQEEALEVQRLILEAQREQNRLLHRIVGTLENLESHRNN